MKTIAFWNINLGNGSDKNKADTFKKWCAAMKPDLLILEEGSSTLTADDYEVISALSGMEVIEHVGTLDKNNEDSTKQLIALVQPKNPEKFAAKALRLPGLQAIRMVIKASCSGLEVYGIHANASQTGG